MSPLPTFHSLTSGKNLGIESDFQFFGLLIPLYFSSPTSPNSTRSDTYKLVTWWWPIFLSFLWASNTHRLASTCVFFLSPIDVWVPLMVIYCRVEQPGLNCTLKLLTILMPPNHPKVYLFPTRRVWGSPLLTVFCGRIQSLEKTCRRTSSAGFQGRLVPSF